MQRRKKALTLMEIMIVILLIGVIGSVIGYNMKGSLEEGRAFKTKQSIAKAYDILQMQIAEYGFDEVKKNVPEALQRSGFFRRTEDYLNDGWGKAFSFGADETKERITITSEKLDSYINAKNKREADYYPWLNED